MLIIMTFNHYCFLSVFISFCQSLLFSELDINKNYMYGTETKSLTQTSKYCVMFVCMGVTALPKPDFEVLFKSGRSRLMKNATSLI